MLSFRLFKSTSTATNTATSTSTTTSVTTSGVSQPESAAGRRVRSSFAGMLTTVHMWQSTQIPTADQQFAKLRLLAEVSASQINPFEALATHRTVTFDDKDKDEYQEHHDDSLSLPNEPSQLVDDSGPIVREEFQETTLAVLPAKDDRDSQARTMTSIPKHEILPSINDHFRRTLSGTVPDALLTELEGDPQHLTSDCYIVGQPDPTDRWILQTGDPIMPLRCGYEGCYKRFSNKLFLQRHFSVHNGDSRFRCYLGKCTGKIRFRDKQALSRHVMSSHTHDRPIRCRLCIQRFARKDCLLRHMRKRHPDAPLDVKVKQPSSRVSSDTIRDQDSSSKHILAKRYICNICDKRFRRSDQLRYHRDHVHSIEIKKKSPKPKRREK